MLLDGHKAGVDNFSILLKENNTFKLKMSKALLISRHKPILNKNTHSLRLELFDYVYFIIVTFIIFISTIVIPYHHCIISITVK